jgi:hypothetical protein
MFLHLFFLAPFTHTPHAARQHLFIDQKQTPPREETEKTAISPHFLKFQKFHFSIMLICAILKIAISTGKKPRFRPPPKKPKQSQLKPKKTQFQTAYLLIERAKSELLNFHLKNSLTGLSNSLKYWVLYCERDFL